MPDHEVTRLLHAFRDGDRSAMDQLVALIYPELQQIARQHLRKERPDHTLDTSAVVHEVYLKMATHPPQVDWSGRKHFYAIAARAVRQVLINHARARHARKRGGDANDLTFDEAGFVPVGRPEILVALDEALERLSELDERQVRIVECRYFTGLTIDETAEALGISTATANRDWAAARLWLNREIGRILETDQPASPDTDPESKHK